MIIYKITNLINGKRYIGQTINSLQKRFKDHANNSNDCYLGRAIQKYGKENFKVEIVCRASNLDELNRREENLIRLYKTLKPHGYNIALGGRNRGRVCSPMRGKNHSAETKKLMSDKAKGRRHSLSARLKISSHKKGVKLSEEHKEKCANSHKGLNYKGTQVIDLNTGIVYKSVTITAKELKIARRSLVRWLNTNIKRSQKNAHFNVAYYKGE